MGRALPIQRTHDKRETVAAKLPRDMRQAHSLALLFALSLGACDSPTTADAGLDGGGDAGLEPLEGPALPEAQGPCPSLEQVLAGGSLSVTPASRPSRGFDLYISEAARDLDGPLVFFWHGAQGAANNVLGAFDQATFDAILELGGMVVAPYSDPALAGSLPWYLSAGNQQHDLNVADEIVACLESTVGVDDSRIHSVGFSAGALHTTQMAYRRASYIASVVTYSGGLIGTQRPPRDEIRNRFAAMALHGGEGDVVAIPFKDATERFVADLGMLDHFALICDHGMNHTVPTEARPSALAFLLAHPFGATSPYEAGLPEGFYSFCALAN